MEGSDVSTGVARPSGLRMKNFLNSPVTHINLLFVGVLIVIGVVHQMAHYDIHTDVHGYCHNLQRK